MIDKQAIEEAASDTLSWPKNKKWDSADKDNRFRALFGVSSELVADIWNWIEARTIDEPGAQPKHLLWALLFMKVYSTEEVHCAVVSWPTVKTFRKWSWYFI